MEKNSLNFSREPALAVIYLKGIMEESRITKILVRCKKQSTIYPIYLKPISINIWILRWLSTFRNRFIPSVAWLFGLEVVFVCAKNKLLKAFVRGMVIPVRIISCLESTRRRFHSLVSGVEILIVENSLFTRSAITMPLNIPSYCGDESTFYSFILPHIRLINVFCFLMQPRNWFFSLQLIFYFRLYLDA